MYSRINLVAIVLIALSFQLSLQFDTTFDYKNQGADWTQGFCNETTYLKDQIQQSPVAVNTSDVSVFSSPHYWFPFYKSTLANINFYNVSVVITPQDQSDSLGFGWVYGSQSDFNRNQEKTVNITIHSPAEHTIDGKQYPIEMQITHQVLIFFLSIAQK